MKRPRGRLLYATVGDAPNQTFVVEWLNARNAHTGNLSTFQVQLYEGTNDVLFLYKEFRPKGTNGYFEIPSVLVGMENSQGTAAVGNAYVFPYGGWLGTLLPGSSPLRSWRFVAMNLIGKVWYQQIPWWFSLATFGPRLPQPISAGDMMGFVYTP